MSRHRPRGSKAAAEPRRAARSTLVGELGRARHRPPPAPLPSAVARRQAFEQDLRMRIFLEVVPGIGAVERFVAEREVGDDVALDRGFQQRPLKPGRVAQMATRDAARRRAAARPARRRETPRPAPNLRIRLPPAARRVGATGRPAGGQICSISPRLCSTSRMRIQTRALTSPSSSTGTSNSSRS